VAALSKDEILVPFVTERHLIPKATLVRSILLMSSVRALREEGYYDRYVQSLPQEHHASLLHISAPQWLPVSLAVAHYEACNRLGLTSSQMLEMGLRVSKHAQGTFIKTIVAFVTSAGADPWTLLAQGRRMWERAWVGSALAIIRTGPKEARIEIVGCPCAHIPYFKSATRGILQSVVQLLCTRAYVSEIGRLCVNGDLAYRLQWA
jgi:hypothetical protein